MFVKVINTWKKRVGESARPWGTSVLVAEQMEFDYSAST